MTHDLPEMMSLELPRPPLTPWRYPLWGILLGAAAGVLVGHPLSRIIRNIQQ